VTALLLPLFDAVNAPCDAVIASCDDVAVRCVAATTPCDAVTVAFDDDDAVKRNDVAVLCDAVPL
jgi:hypothetical protein